MFFRHTNDWELKRQKTADQLKGFKTHLLNPEATWQTGFYAPLISLKDHAKPQIERIGLRLHILPAKSVISLSIEGQSINNASLESNQISVEKNSEALKQLQDFLNTYANLIPVPIYNAILQEIDTYINQPENLVETSATSTIGLTA